MWYSRYFFVNLPTKEKYIIMEGQTKLSAGQIGILINARIKDMAMWLMEDFKYSLEEALDCVYNSELFEKLQDLETGLYYQSSGYNYELLKEEIKYGQYQRPFPDIYNVFNQGKGFIQTHPCQLSVRFYQIWRIPLFKKNRAVPEKHDNGCLSRLYEVLGWLWV